MPDAQDQTQEDLDRLGEKRDEQLTAQLAAFEDSLAKLVATWQEEIEKLLTHPVNAIEQDRIRQLAYLTTHISAQLTRLGYNRLAHQMISQYDQALHAADEQLAALGIPLGRLAPINEDALRALKEIDFQRLMRLGSNTTAALTEGIVLTVIEGLPRAQVVSQVAKTLGSFRQYAYTYVETGMNVYARYVHWEKLSKAVAKWRYSGPLDAKTRPFCREHVNKVYTSEQLDALDNGHQECNPVHLWLGGWGCRHWLTAVVTP